MLFAKGSEIMTWGLCWAGHLSDSITAVSVSVWSRTKEEHCWSDRASHSLQDVTGVPGACLMVSKITTIQCAAKFAWQSKPGIKWHSWAESWNWPCRPDQGNHEKTAARAGLSSETTTLPEILLESVVVYQRQASELRFSVTWPYPRQYDLRSLKNWRVRNKCAWILTAALARQHLSAWVSSDKSPDPATEKHVETHWARSHTDLPRQ